MPRRPDSLPPTPCWQNSTSGSLGSRIFSGRALRTPRPRRREMTELSRDRGARAWTVDQHPSKEVGHRWTKRRQVEVGGEPEQARRAASGATSLSVPPPRPGPTRTGAVSDRDEKATLHRYLQTGRDAVVWKLAGLSEYDVRRPLVPTGTNLLGLVKHLACVELGYFGETFGRPSGEPNPWLEEEPEDNGDLWATPDESREEIVGLYKRAWAHADATIGALALDVR